MGEPYVSLLIYGIITEFDKPQKAYYVLDHGSTSVTSVATREKTSVVHWDATRIAFKLQKSELDESTISIRFMKPAGRIMGGERLIGVTTFNCKDLGTLHYPVSVDAGSPDAFTAPIIKKGTTRGTVKLFVETSGWQCLRSMLKHRRSFGQALANFQKLASSKSAKTIQYIRPEILHVIAAKVLESVAKDDAAEPAEDLRRHSKKARSAFNLSSATKDSAIHSDSIGLDHIMLSSSAPTLKPFKAVSSKENLTNEKRNINSSDIDRSILSRPANATTRQTRSQTLIAIPVTSTKSPSSDPALLFRLMELWSSLSQLDMHVRSKMVRSGVLGIFQELIASGSDVAVRLHFIECLKHFFTINAYQREMVKAGVMGTLLKFISRPNYLLQMKAFEVLLYFDDEFQQEMINLGIVKKLIRLLRSSNPSIQSKALELIQYFDSKYQAQIISPAVLKQIIELISFDGTKEIAQSLMLKVLSVIQRLDSTYKMQLIDRGILEPLVGLLKIPNPKTQLKTLDALGEFIDIHEQALIDAGLLHAMNALIHSSEPHIVMKGLETLSSTEEVVETGLLNRLALLLANGNVDIQRSVFNLLVSISLRVTPDQLGAAGLLSTLSNMIGTWQPQSATHILAIDLLMQFESSYQSQFVKYGILDATLELLKSPKVLPVVKSRALSFLEWLDVSYKDKIYSLGGIDVLLALAKSASSTSERALDIVTSMPGWQPLFSSNIRLLKALLGLLDSSSGQIKLACRDLIAKFTDKVRLIEVGVVQRLVEAGLREQEPVHVESSFELLTSIPDAPLELLKANLWPSLFEYMQRKNASLFVVELLLCFIALIVLLGHSHPTLLKLGASSTLLHLGLNAVHPEHIRLAAINTLRAIDKYYTEVADLYAKDVLSLFSAKSEALISLALDLVCDIGPSHPRLLEFGIIQRLIRQVYYSIDVEIRARCLSTLEDIHASGKLARYLLHRYEPDLFDYYTVKISARHVHSSLAVSNGSQTVAAVGKMKKGWRTAIADKPVSGVKSWEICLDKCSSAGNIMIGVCQQEHLLATYIGQSTAPKGWSLYGATTGYLYHDGICNPNYGSRMRQGQVIGVTLDTIAGVLSFSVDGKSLGVAFSSGLQGLDLYPAVSLYDQGDQVTFRDTTTVLHTSGSQDEAVEPTQVQYLDKKTTERINVLVGEHPSQKWKLAFRASRHGWSSTIFHARCDQQGPTITLVKLEKSKAVFGGYASVSWELSGGYKADPNAILFSLIAADGYPTEATHVQRQSPTRNTAIYCQAKYGPCFGHGFDLCIDLDHPSSSYSQLEYTYSAPDGPRDKANSLAGTLGPWGKYDVEVYTRDGDASSPTLRPGSAFQIRLLNQFIRLYQIESTTVRKCIERILRSMIKEHRKDVMNELDRVVVDRKLSATAHSAFQPLINKVIYPGILLLPLLPFAINGKAVSVDSPLHAVLTNKNATFEINTPLDIVLSVDTDSAESELPFMTHFLLRAAPRQDLSLLNGAEIYGYTERPTIDMHTADIDIVHMTAPVTNSANSRIEQQEVNIPKSILAAVELPTPPPTAKSAPSLRGPFGVIPGFEHILPMHVSGSKMLAESRWAKSSRFGTIPGVEDRLTAPAAFNVNNNSRVDSSPTKLEPRMLPRASNVSPSVSFCDVASNAAPMDQAMADGDDVNKHAPITTKGRREKVKDKDEKAKMDEDESKSHVKKRRKDSKASFATTSRTHRARTLSIVDLPVRQGWHVSDNDLVVKSSSPRKAHGKRPSDGVGHKEKRQNKFANSSLKESALVFDHADSSSTRLSRARATASTTQRSPRTTQPSPRNEKQWEICASSSDSEVRVKPGGLGHGSEGHEDTEDISASQERSIDLLSKQSSSLSIGSVMEVEVSAIRAHGPPRVQPVFPTRHIASSKRRHSRLQALDLNTFTASEDLEELSSSAKDGVEEPTKALTASREQLAMSRASELSETIVRKTMDIAPSRYRAAYRRSLGLAESELLSSLSASGPTKSKQFANTSNSYNPLSESSQEDSMIRVVTEVNQRQEQNTKDSQRRDAECPAAARPASSELDRTTHVSSRPIHGDLGFIEEGERASSGRSVVNQNCVLPIALYGLKADEEHLTVASQPFTNLGSTSQTVSGPPPTSSIVSAHDHSAAVSEPSVVSVAPNRYLERDSSPTADEASPPLKHSLYTLNTLTKDKPADAETVSHFRAGLLLNRRTVELGGVRSPSAVLLSSSSDQLEDKPSPLFTTSRWEHDEGFDAAGHYSELLSAMGSMPPDDNYRDPERVGRVCNILQEGLETADNSIAVASDSQDDHSRTTDASPLLAVLDSFSGGHGEQCIPHPRRVKYIRIKLDGDSVQRLALTFLGAVAYYPLANDNLPPPDTSTITNIGERLGISYKATRTLRYNADFDTNGLFYWIGTNEGRSNWRNPAHLGKISIHTSHPMFESTMNKEQITGRSNNTTFWGGSSPQFVTIDLRSYEIFATHFTLKHGYHASNSFIQEFQLQGSKDGKSWVAVHEQHGTPFAKAFGTATFRIWDGRDYFRFWKVIQYGTYCMGPGKASGGAPYICLCGLELYGDVRYDQRR